MGAPGQRPGLNTTIGEAPATPLGLLRKKTKQAKAGENKAEDIFFYNNDWIAALRSQ